MSDSIKPVEKPRPAKRVAMDLNTFVFVCRGNAIILTSKDPYMPYDGKRTKIASEVYRKFNDGLPMGECEIYDLIIETCEENGVEPVSVIVTPAFDISETKVAYKVWSRDDIKGVLQEKNCKGDNNEIDAVINTGWLDALNDCTDEDWQTIANAIEYAISIGNIVPIQDKDESDETDE